MLFLLLVETDVGGGLSVITVSYAKYIFLVGGLVMVAWLRPLQIGRDIKVVGCVVVVTSDRVRSGLGLGVVAELTGVTRSTGGILNVAHFLCFEFFRSRHGLLIDIPASKRPDNGTNCNAGIVDYTILEGHLFTGTCDNSEAAADEGRDEELGGNDGSGYCVVSRRNGGEGGHGAVAEGIREGTQSDHAQQFDPIVLENEGEGGETFVVGNQALDPFSQDGPRKDEGTSRPGNSRRRQDEPALPNSIDKTGDGCAGRVAYQWWECSREGDRPQDCPASSGMFPTLSEWFEPAEDLLVED